MSPDELFEAAGRAGPMTGQSVSLALSFVCWAWLAAVALLMVVDSEIVTKHHLDQHAPRMLACALILLVLALVP